METLKKKLNSLLEAKVKLDESLMIKLPKSILQEAIHGRLVPQDPSDEPASALLEKIWNEKQQLVKDGKIKTKDNLRSIIFRGDDNTILSEHLHQKNYCFFLSNSLTSQWPFCVHPIHVIS